MIHQRNVLRLYYIFAALIALALSTVIGSVIVSMIIVAVISLPIVFLIKKVMPAPDWYANEDEKSNMTSLNLTPARNSEEKK